MRKFLAALGALALMGTGALLNAASAEELASVDGLGSASTNDDYQLLLDGEGEIADSDPTGTLDGFIGVDDEGNVQCDSDGDGYVYEDLNEDGDFDDEGETRPYDGGCEPPSEPPSI